MTPRLLALAAIFLAGILASPGARAALPQANPVRDWSPEGAAPARGALVAFDGRTVVLRLANGQKAELPASSLGGADRDYLEAWLDTQPVVMPDSVGVDSAKLPVEVVREDEAEQIYVYRTPHFEFTSEGKLTQNLLRDVARNFEATYELVKALPWGISPEPEEGDRFRALLVRTRSRYAELGGPENSGGVYFRSKKLFIIPFESMGIEPVGKSYKKASDYRSDTLVHELTHQMMHSWLELLPTWVVEGTAEYTNILPLRLGTFRVSASKTGLKDYLSFLKARGGVPDPYPIDELLAVDHGKWNAILASSPKESHRLYFTAYLLVNYFMSLDGNGDGARFVKYLRAIGKYRQQLLDYETAVDAFKKLPGVEVSPDGRYRWPNSLTHPTKPAFLDSPEQQAEIEKSTLAILLDGRTPEQLADQIRTAYRRLGVRL